MSNTDPRVLPLHQQQLVAPLEAERAAHLAVRAAQANTIDRLTRENAELAARLQRYHAALQRIARDAPRKPLYLQPEQEIAREALSE